MCLLTALFQLFLLSLGDIDVNPFFGHLSHPFLSSTDIVVYNRSISERRKQSACWSTSTNLMAIKNNLLPLKKRYAWCNSSATNVYICGWTASVSIKTTYRPPVLSLLKNFPSPVASTPRLVKPVPTVHGSLSRASMRTA